MKTKDRLFSGATLGGLYLCMFAAHAQNGPFLYVPSNVSVTPPLGVSVVDTSTNTVPFAPIPAGPGIAVAVRGDESVAWVSNNTNGTVTPLETAANTLGGPIQLTGGSFVEGLAITPNGETLYATTVSMTGSPGAEGFLTPINTATNTAGPAINVGLNPRDAVVSPVGNNTVWVANEILADGQGAVTRVVNNVAGVPIELGAGQQAFGLAITPNGNALYATNPFGPNVAVINTSTGTVTTINVGGGSFGIAPTPNGQSIYVALAFAHEVAVINVASNMVIFIPLPPGPNSAAIPNGVAVSPDGKTVYVTDLLNNEVIPISTNNNMPGTPIPVVDMPEIFPGIASNGNALLAGGLTFVANTSGALESTLASGLTGSLGPIFTGGTLQFAGPNITSSLPITLEAQGGTFDTLANTATLSGTISGPGALTKIGTGTLILTGDNTYDGGTTINAGTLQLGNGGTTGRIVGNVTDDGTLVFNRGGAKKTFDGAISGSGELVKMGSDTLVLTANNTYSGGTIINDGTLVAGVPNAAQAISNALGAGDVFLNGGTLRTPSLDPLVINIRGNYTQGPGGTLALGVAGTNPGDYDHVQVGGNASLNGALTVVSLNGFHPKAGDVFGVLRTNGTRSGTFTHLNDFLSNNLVPELRPLAIEVVAPNGVDLIYAAAPTPTPPPGTGPPIVENPNPLPEAPFPPAEVVGILDPTAEQLTSLFEISFSGANSLRFNLDDRMTQIQQGSTGFVSPIPAPLPPPEAKATIGEGKGEGKEVAPPPVFQPTPQNRWGVWVNGWGDFVSIDNDNFAKGYNFTTGGVSTGIDYRITEHFALGIFGSYAHTWTSLQPSGNIDVDTGRGGLYATYFDHGFYLNTAAFGAYNSYDTRRQGLLGAASGSSDGYEFSTFLDAGYNFSFGNLSVGPTGAVQYTNVHVNGFSEHGSLIPLTVHEDSEESWRTDLGLQASYTWHCGNVLVIPSVTAAWEHEFKYSTLPITVSAPALGGATATFFGPNEGHDSAIINAGVGVLLNQRISVYVGYQGQVGRKNYDANGVTGTIGFSF